MELESYFDIDETGEIRLSGTRVGIESVLYEHIQRGRSPEEIAERLPSLSREQIYASILLYLHDRKRFGEYMTRWLEDGERRRDEQKRNPPPVVARLQHRLINRPRSVHRT